MSNAGISAVDNFAAIERPAKRASTIEHPAKYDRACRHVGMAVRNGQLAMPSGIRGLEIVLEDRR